MLFRQKRPTLLNGLKKIEKEFITEECLVGCQLMYLSEMHKKELLDKREISNSLCKEAKLLFNNSLNAFDTRLITKNDLNSLKDNFMEYYSGRVAFVILCAKQLKNKRVNKN